MSNHGNALLRRVRGKLLREVPVWGLSDPVTIEGGGGTYEIQSSSERDALVAEGFVTAEVAMFNIDLRRRLWSGRLSELVGDRKLAPGLRTPDLDVFTRIIGFRADAERSFRHLNKDAKSRLELYATGVNAWTDAGLWRKQPCWARASSRPRLWTPSDSLLLAQARARMDACAAQALHVAEEAWAAGWTEDGGRSVQRLWDLLRKLPHTPREPVAGDGLAQDSVLSPTALRWGGREPTASVPSGIPHHLNSAGSPGADRSPGEAPVILPITILPGGDNHRYACGDQPPRRLQARRHDVEVRQSTPQRHWIRRNEHGGLISDLIHRANDKIAPSGQGFFWSWNGTPSKGVHGDASADSSLDLGLFNVSNLGTLPKTRLVPIEGGA